jgi:alkanesulfonate monooxygenase SsuD/methylene tetrahydromethanopterin reductase-like flavin-dependent oxidoreductase (luciferase family)
MTRPLQVGIQLPEVERVVRFEEYRALAVAAEEAGADSVWLGDHLLYRDDGGVERGPWDVWTLLAAIAASTSRVRLGPLVACTAFHPPAVLAKMAATVDEVSGGRLELGLGAGWNEAEFRAFGIPYDRRVARFCEAFTIIAALTAGDRITLDGQFHAVEDAVQLPAPRRPVPLMIGSNGPRMLAATIARVDSWNTWYASYQNSVAGFATLNATITEAAEVAGRDPATLRRSACVAVRIGSGAGGRPHDGDAPFVMGGASAVAEHLAALAAAGADEAIIVADPIDASAIALLAEVLERLDA